MLTAVTQAKLWRKQEIFKQIAGSNCVLPYTATICNKYHYINKFVIIKVCLSLYSGHLCIYAYMT